MDADNIFYAPGIQNSQYRLSQEESAHCRRALRHKTGDSIFVTDGTGNMYRCKIVSFSGDLCNIQVLEDFQDWQQRDYSVHIAVAPTKNIARFEFFLEKCTEIGVSEITPIFCQNSERRTINMKRLKKITVSALKQSKQALLPIMNPPVDLKWILNKPPNKYKRFIANYSTGNPYLADLYNKNESVLVIIGPEGDFSLDELNLAIENKVIPVNLGNTRLRTETAGISACHTISLINCAANQT